MSCPRFRKPDGVRLRPVPELQTCLVYTAARPQLYTLNPHAWLVLALAPGRGERELAEAYVARTSPPLTELVAQRHLREALAMLTETGILELV